MELGEHFQQYLSTLFSVVLLSFVFYFPERLAPAEKSQAPRRRFFNLAYMPFVLALIFSLQVLFGPLYSYLLNASGGGFLPKLFDPPSGLAAQLFFALVFAFVWDLWQYGIHRLQHLNAFLWQTHKFHHSEVALNSTTQARHHALNYVLYIISYLPVFLLFGSQQPHFIAVFVMFRLWGFVNHANVRINLGPLTPFVSGPQWHRIHHSVNTEHFNRNFAAFFPCIDMLFGTYYAPRPGEYPRTGLPPTEQDADLREATVAPLVAWRKMAWLMLGSVKNHSTRLFSPSSQPKRGLEGEVGRVKRHP
jgi:sterol desaturase/sphingolipid hydroxylase (fatty acid hydroxylase superfamily)